MLLKCRIKTKRRFSSPREKKVPAHNVKVTRNKKCYNEMEFMHWCTRTNTSNGIWGFFFCFLLGININERIIFNTAQNEDENWDNFFCFHRLPCIFPSMSPQANCIRFHNHEYLKIYRLTRFQLKFIQFNNIKKELFFIGRTFAGEMNFTFNLHTKKCMQCGFTAGFTYSRFLLCHKLELSLKKLFDDLYICLHAP